MPNFTFINFNPTPQAPTVRDLIEIEEIGSNLSSVDFDDSNESSYIRSSINKDGDLIKDKATNIVADILTNVQIEFSEKFELYSFLSKNEDFDSYFPFSIWGQEINELKYLTGDVIYLEMFDVLKGFLEIKDARDDNDFLISNMAYFLDSKLDIHFRNNCYYNMLDFVISKIDEKIILADILSCDSTSQYMKVLKGQKVESENFDRLIDAAIIITNLNSREQKNLKDVKKSFSINKKEEDFDFRAHCNEFSKSDIWNKVVNNETALNKFIEKFGVPSEKKNYFFKVSSSMGKNYRIEGIKEGNLQIFFDEVIKGNSELGQKLLDNIEKYIPLKLKEQFEFEKNEAKKVMTYYELQENVPIEAEFVTKKPKL